MGTRHLLTLDTLDDRRAVYGLLHRLPPRDRVRFVAWACGRAPTGRGRLPVPVVAGLLAEADRAYRCDRADARLTAGCYADLMQLFNAFDVDPGPVARELEVWVRRPGHRPPPGGPRRGRPGPPAPPRA